MGMVTMNHRKKCLRLSLLFLLAATVSRAEASAPRIRDKERLRQQAKGRDQMRAEAAARWKDYGYQ